MIENIKNEIAELNSKMTEVIVIDFNADDSGVMSLDTKKVNLGNMEEVYEVIQTMNKSLCNLHGLLNS